MAEIQFEGEQEFARPSAVAQEPRGLTALVMKWGLAKDEKTARYVLLGVAGTAIVLTIIFASWNSHGTSRLPVVPQPYSSSGL